MTRAPAGVGHPSNGLPPFADEPWVVVGVASPPAPSATRVEGALAGPSVREEHPTEESRPATRTRAAIGRNGVRVIVILSDPRGGTRGSPARTGHSATSAAGSVL